MIFKFLVQLLDVVQKYFIFLELILDFFVIIFTFSLDYIGAIPHHVLGFATTGWSGKDIVPREVEETNKVSSIGGSAKSRTQNWVRTTFKGESYFNLGNSCLGRIMSSPKHPFIALLRRGGENKEDQASWSQLE